MMRLAAIAAVVAVLAGCDFPHPPPVDKTGGMNRYHDDEKSVTCWRVGSGNLSCYPDWMLGAPKDMP